MADNRFPPGGYYGSGFPEYSPGADAAGELLRLLDGLEALIGAAVRIPWINKVLLDREELLDIIDQMRVSIPAEPAGVSVAEQEADELLERARAEADEILRRAQEQAYALVAETDQVKAAQVFVKKILDDAQFEAADIKHGADNYALDVLTRLESQLAAQLNTIRGGVRALEATAANGNHPPEDVPSTTSR